MHATLIRTVLVLTIALAAVTVCSPAAFASSAAVDGRVSDELRSTGAVEALVEVSFEEGFAHIERAAVQNDTGGVVVLDRLQQLPLALVRFTSEQALRDVASATGVVAIRPNAELRASLVQSLGLVRQPEVVAAGHAGRGAYVAVLDTGLDYRSHPAYFGPCPSPGAPGCRVAATFEAAPDDGALDDGGHGTHVASIVARVAPGASIIGIDVFHVERDAQGQLVRLASVADIARAVNWVVEQRRRGLNIRALNLSLGGGSYTGACRDDYGLGVARAAGILPIVAAGNGAYGQRGREGLFTDGIASPACVPGAVAVGSVHDAAFGPYRSAHCTDTVTAPDLVSCFSQTGARLSLWAPGSSIDAAGGVKSGTSMAAPHVAGAVAVLAGAQPSASPDRIEQVLVGSGPEIRDPRNGVVRRRLDLAAAVGALVGVARPQPQPQPKPAPRPQPTGPTVASPAHSVAYLAAAGPTTVPVDVTISGRGGAARVGRLFLYVSREGGAWQLARVRTVSVLSRGLQRTAVVRTALAPGFRYTFATRASDTAGRLSGMAYGAPFRLDAHEERSSSIAWSPGWLEANQGRGHGALLRYATARQATATLGFTGSSVGWLARTGAGRGHAYVFVDGVFRMTVDLGPRQGAAARRVVFSQAFASPGPHTLQIQVVGTPGRPRVDVDAFLVLG